MKSVPLDTVLLPTFSRANVSVNLFCDMTSDFALEGVLATYLAWFELQEPQSLPSTSTEDAIYDAAASIFQAKMKALQAPALRGDAVREIMARLTGVPVPPELRTLLSHYFRQELTHAA
jgi:hypothetical protein